MILPYLPRLVILSLALFFFVYLAVVAMVSLIAPWVIGKLERVRPGHAANGLFGLRMLPAALAFLTVAALCVPSYLELEPEATLERVGWLSLLAALLGVSAGCVSIFRAGRAIRCTAAYARHCERVGVPISLPGENLPVWAIDDRAPVFALFGILRPRLVVSQGVLTALSPEQLTAVLRHEHAHRLAQDNLKRLLMLLAPGGSQLVERAWNRQIEWAADDTAGEKLHLAEALIAVARIGTMSTGLSLVSSLIAEEQDLAVRVERLIDAAARNEMEPWRRGRLIGIVAIVALPLVAAALYTILPQVHTALEYLIR